MTKDDMKKLVLALTMLPMLVQGQTLEECQQAAGSREELSVDTAVWTCREDHPADGGQYPERMAAAGVSISTGNVSE